MRCPQTSLSFDGATDRGIVFVFRVMARLGAAMNTTRVVKEAWRKRSSKRGVPFTSYIGRGIVIINEERGLRAIREASCSRCERVLPGLRVERLNELRDACFQCACATSYRFGGDQDLVGDVGEFPVRGCDVVDRSRDVV